MKRTAVYLTESKLQEMASVAWECREHAYILGNTRVGAAVMSDDGKIYAGCNVEHQFRSHDIHAEVNAISTMVASGRTELIAIVIVSEQRLFTPCGACMDWIYQFGGPSCIVAVQSEVEGKVRKFKSKDLMPHYPK